MAKVNVPQQDGEISISFAGDDPIVFEVANGTVEVPDDQVTSFLARVNGAELETPAAFD